jgi:hypothetical protein
MINNIIYLIFLTLLMALSAAFRAAHDTMTHAPEKLAKWGPFWDSTTSWKLKYKGGDSTAGPAFLGSTTVFVAFTDGWHLTNALAWACADTAFLLGSWPTYHWYAVAAVAVRRVVFQPIYSLLRR